MRTLLVTARHFLWGNFGQFSREISEGEEYLRRGSVLHARMRGALHADDLATDLNEDSKRLVEMRELTSKDVEEVSAGGHSLSQAKEIVDAARSLFSGVDFGAVLSELENKVQDAQRLDDCLKQLTFSTVGQIEAPFKLIRSQGRTTISEAKQREKVAAFAKLLSVDDFDKLFAASQLCPLTFPNEALVHRAMQPAAAWLSKCRTVFSPFSLLFSLCLSPPVLYFIAPSHLEEWISASTLRFLSCVCVYVCVCALLLCFLVLWFGHLFGMLPIVSCQ